MGAVTADEPMSTTERPVVPGAGVTPVSEALARLYDLDLADDPGDLDLYLALAGRTGGPILELGAGTGRLAVPLAVAGHRVTAVDLDPAMLVRARRRARDEGPAVVERLELVEADLLDLEPAGQPVHRLVFIGLNSLFLLGERDAQLGAFRAMARHLARGGLAVADVWLPDADDLARFDGRLILEYVRTDPETGNLVTKTAAAEHDATTGTVELTTIFEEGLPGAAPARWVRRDRLRLVSPDELATFAAVAGLEVEVIAGGYDLSPIRPGHDRAIIVAARH
jgi:SAM-dependent methyltransferase